MNPSLEIRGTNRESHRRCSCLAHCGRCRCSVSLLVVSLDYGPVFAFKHVNVAHVCSVPFDRLKRERVLKELIGTQLEQSMAKERDPRVWACTVFAMWDRQALLRRNFARDLYVH